MADHVNPFMRLVRGIARGLDALRRALHLLLLLALFSVLLLGIVGAPVEVPATAALVLDPDGLLVEQLAGDPLERALGEIQGTGVRQVRVQDLVESLDAAADDERIRAVVLRLEMLETGGLPMLQAIADALRRVKESGKKVIALGDSFDEGQYYLAAQADEIYLNELGLVEIDGFGYYRTYLKGALERLRVDLNVFRVGEYKSFVEPFIRDDMSEEDRKASSQWLQAMWQVYQRDVVAARRLDPGSLDDYANNFVTQLQGANGSASQLALQRRLVDGLMSRQAFRDYMVGIVGSAAEGGSDFSQIDYQSYLEAVRSVELPQPHPANIAVLVAAGEIIDGEAPSGTIGGDSLAALVRDAADDESVRALVLRVDSPGGSMFASEVVLSELSRLQAAGKPLVVSMGSVAASGGYYISMGADEIWASESTITGSIGVGAIIPTVDRTLDALGIHVDGIGTTRLAGQMRLDRPLGVEARAAIDAMVQEAYRIFVGKVAESREMELARADEIARGRVWIGSDAEQLGLVDSIGDLDDAIDAAASRAGLEPGAYEVRELEPEMSLPARLVTEWMRQAVRNLVRMGIRLPAPGSGLFAKLLASVEREATALSAFNDPRGLYSFCNCSY